MRRVLVGCETEILTEDAAGAGIICPMTREYFSQADSIRAEIATAAARMIAEDGASYGDAKRKAAIQILGNDRAAREFLPDNAQIEEEVRIYNELFLADSQPARLQHLRELALDLMEDLVDYHPYLTGAVLNGTAGEHSDIHLQLFVDNPKEVEIYLLNRGVDFEVSEAPGFRAQRDPVEVLSFLREGEGVHLSLYRVDDRRGAMKVRRGERQERADIEAVKLLVRQEPAS